MSATRYWTRGEPNGRSSGTAQFTYRLIQGEPLYFVQKQLGYRDAKTTERHEHMAASFLTERVDRHDDALWLPRPSRHEAPA